MAAGFKLCGLFHREDRWIKERSLYQALVTTLEIIRCTYFGHKTFHGCWILITYNITFIAWTIILVTWGVITALLNYVASSRLFSHLTRWKYLALWLLIAFFYSLHPKLYNYTDSDTKQVVVSPHIIINLSQVGAVPPAKLILVISHSCWVQQQWQIIHTFKPHAAFTLITGIWYRTVWYCIGSYTKHSNSIATGYKVL